MLVGIARRIVMLFLPDFSRECDGIGAPNVSEFTGMRFEYMFDRVMVCSFVTTSKSATGR